MAMSGRELVVYRERLGRFEEVGFVGASEVALTFSYSDSYRRNDSAQSISHALPLGAGELPPSAVKSFFDGLLPEGSMRRVLSASFHTSEDDLHELISRLNDESAGALVFKVAGEDPAWGRGYEPMGDSDFERFAAFPREFASHAAVRSRLSLAGAQMKVGLHFDAATDAWQYPKGAAPSSHIVKACDGSFPLQTINEAVCMATAAGLGFDAAECRLIPIDGSDPLLAVKRFDRIDVGSEFFHRLHQEDFFQALPKFGDKYEPTDGNYANNCAKLINEESANPFGDRAMLFSRLVFDWAVGNADNHLKNHSMLWSDDWSRKSLAPLYDVTSTTVYPEVDREMGVSFGGSRRVDQVTRSEVAATAKACGVGEKRGLMELDETIEEFPVALQASVEAICDQGFELAEEMGDRIKKDFLKRRELMA